MSILIKTVRIAGFRGLKNIEVELEQTTILTGMNNTGKTSFLKGLQLALGSRQFISQDDFFIQGDFASEKITIDLLIVPVNDEGNQCDDFSEDWEDLFTIERVRNDGDGKSFVPLRTVIVFDEFNSNYKTNQYILNQWPEFENESINWFDTSDLNNTNFYFDELPFFYMDAQRDILADIKLRSSHLGKMLSKIKYDNVLIEKMEATIEELNKDVVDKSLILSNLKSNLKELNTAMDNDNEGIDITPFPKNIRDLNKGLTIYYTDHQESFPMECHGMGTRSWSSLLTLKAFVSLLSFNADENNLMFFPLLAIEEPEAHLHPNAQKKLYGQIDTIIGQKIISTHSPSIASAAKLKQIRNFYKNEYVICGKIQISDPEDIRKINRHVINTRGEIFFSKVIVFFEGETEEQALPIFAQKFFDKTPVEMGLDFVGVSGHGNYLPFLRFAEALKIPWLIFSDAENTPEKKVKISVRGQFSKCGSTKSESDCVVFVDDGNDFEKQLINDGFSDEIKKAISSLCAFVSDEHKISKEGEITNYDDDKLYDIITNSKAQYGPEIAEQIIQTDKDLPPKVLVLFNKIAVILNIQEVEA